MKGMNNVELRMSTGKIYGEKGRIEMGAENYAMLSSTNGHPGANCMTAQTSGSNANEIIKEIDKVTADISSSLPKGMILADVTSTKDFLDASIANVVETLVVAILLVVLVVYFFLHDMGATLIPSLAIIVSLIGTFAFLYVVGFSLNLLILFALVLVIGTVVDDSIVVVEAVQARLRPILMTSMTMVFGMLPLMFAHGVGANGNISVGVSTVGGMLFGTIGLLFVVPTLFIVFQTIQEHFKRSGGR